MSAIAGCFGDRPTDQLHDAASTLLAALEPFNDRESALVEGQCGVFGIHQSSIAQPDGQSPPFATQNLLCVADARLDNRAELAGRLALDNTATDAEFVLSAWRQSGKLFGTLIGDYAYVVANCGDQSIHLVRGPSGERPLFFAIEDGCVYFASMPWALIARPQLWHGWNERALAAMLLEENRPAATSYYAGIEQVLPGEAVTIIAGVVHRRARWTPSPTVMSNGGIDEAVLAYRSVLDESVRARLRRPQARVAAQLSSGWDSSALAATAAQLLDADEQPLIGITSAPTAAFVADPTSRMTVDESNLAALTAAHNGIEHHIVRPDRPILPRLRDYVRRYQDPRRNFVNSSWWDASLELARDHGANVLFTGEFGNLTINRGNRDDFGDLIRRRQWRRWFSEAHAALVIGELRWAGILYHSFRHLLPARLSAWLLERRLRGVSEDSARLVPRELAREAVKWVKAHRPDPMIKTGSDLAIETIMASDRGTFRKGDLAEFGVDVRDATSDERAISFGYALAPEMLIGQGELRPMARRALSDRIPAAVLANRRRGTQGADWFHTIRRDDAAEILEEISANETVARLLDLPKIRRLIDDWPKVDDGSFGLARIYSMRLPAALATGLFIVEAEKIAGKGTPVSS